MKYSRLFVGGLLIVLLSCNSHSSLKDSTIQDFVKQSEFKLIDTSKYVTFNEFIKSYDTIPVEFGYLIFNNIINPIPIDSCRFRKTWTWNIDTIKRVRAIKTNLRLDPKRKLSSNTYFFVVEFISHDSLRIAAAIYIDLGKNKMGTYFVSQDSFKYARLDNDSIKVSGIMNKIIMHRH